MRASVIATATFGFLALWAGVGRTQDLVQAVKDQMARYEAQLEALAAWCEQEGLSAEAVKTRQWLRQPDSHCLYLPVLPREEGPPPLPEDTPAKVQQWYSRFWQLRRQQASALEALARRAVRADRASLAFSLVIAAVRENPDHPGLRRLLGYQKYQGRWLTLYEMRQLRSNRVWHDKFGWLPRDHVRRYESGMRYVAGQWITAEEDARRHAEMDDGWVIPTEHYLIRTNHSLEAGVALAEKLERLYRVWRQLFVRYYASEAEVIAMFDARPQPRPAWTPPKHRVDFYRDRNDYVRALKPRFANVELSTGFYADGVAHFFAGEGYDDRTLYHEATHQLFHESRPVSLAVGRQGNFWIIEGVAMYMESLREADGFYVVGGRDDVRMRDARFRLLKDDFYVPLSEFVTLGMEQLQADKRIRALYSQAAGLTHFLIHYDGGRYRDALVAYLTAVYTGRDGPQTLAQLAGVSLRELDRQYREFMSH